MTDTTRNKRLSQRRWDQVGRKLVQIGFLLLFLYPFVPIIYKKITFNAAPTMTSWLLAWDPLLLLGQAVHGEWLVMVVGAPLLLLALSLLLGRAFCGWVCPMGTLLDFASGLAFWRKGKHRVKLSRGQIQRRNSWARYYLLIFVVAGGLFSLKWLGLVDPLVIFQRVSTSTLVNAFTIQQAGLRVVVAVVSLLFVAMVVLEFWQPRFWCRNLCPMGAMISLVSRWSVLNRKVNTSCTGCGECVRTCPMRAIPREPHDTDYSDCTFCLECQTACPKTGISFQMGGLAQMRWQAKPSEELERRPVREGQYAPMGKLGWWKVNRRQALSGIGIGLAGLVLTPLSRLAPKRGLLRPPGALPEAEFVQTCIACQECVRVCPTGGLRPVFLEGGLEAVGTPQLMPRQGGCSLNPSCPNLCAQVCPVGAIRVIAPREMKVGVARVDRSLCLAWDQGVKCLVCVEACLNEAAQVNQGRITVDADKCTGCGRCESGCPVAGSAIHVEQIL